jgi:hypothetical protein
MESVWLLMYASVSQVGKVQSAKKVFVKNALTVCAWLPKCALAFMGTKATNAKTPLVTHLVSMGMLLVLIIASAMQGGKVEFAIDQSVVLK